MVSFAAGPGEHPLVRYRDFRSEAELVVYLMHKFAYEHACRSISGGAVLDLGCNTGYGLLELATAADRVTGIDVSPRAVDEARRLVEGRGIPVHLFDGGALPFSNGSFDVVTSFQVIEHVEDVPAYLAEIRRVLKSGGRAFLTTPNRLIRLDPGMAPWNPHHLREYAPDELEQTVGRVLRVDRLLGLFATPEIERVERARLDAARADARRRQSPGLASSLRNAVKATLPSPALDALRAVRTRLGADAEGRGKQPLPKHSTADFHYRDDDLDTALDLMVVCRA